MEELNVLVAELGSAFLIIDFYATWCPPCRSAAPVFAQWSKDYKQSDFIFAKVDVDRARSVASHYRVRAMPTFKILNSQGVEIKSVTGWRKSEIQSFLSEKSK